MRPRLDLAVRRVDGDVRATCVGTAAATRDPRHLADLLCARLAQIDPGLLALLSAEVAVKPQAGRARIGFRP